MMMSSADGVFDGSLLACLTLLVVCLVATPSHQADVSVGGQTGTGGGGAAAGLCSRSCRCSHNMTIANCSYGNHVDVPDVASTVRVLVLDWNALNFLNFTLRTHPVVAGSNDSLLESLSVAHNNLTDIAASTFRGLTGLRQLHLNDNNLRQLATALFADTPSLEVLSLADNPLLDVIGVAPAFRVAPPRFLRSLDLSGTRVGSSSSSSAADRLPAEIFRQLPALEQLTLRKASVANMSAEYFSALNATSGLRSLDLRGSSLTDVDPGAFELLADSLRELVLDDAIIATKQLENVLEGFSGNGSRLDTLSLRNVFVYEAHESAVSHHLFKHLANTKLKTLHMDGNNVGLHGARIPEKLFHPVRHLTTLTLTRCDIKSIPGDTFKGLHQLQTLDLSHNLLTCARQSDCGFMTSSQAILTHLRTLDMSDNLLTTGSDDNVNFRFGDGVFPELADLDLSRNRLTSLADATFSQMPKLTRLRLNGNDRLADIELGAFARLPNLVRLELDGCRRLTHLRQGALSGLGRLRVLSIQNAGLVHVHHSIFAHLDHLDEIYLRNNQLGQQGASFERVAAPRTNHLRMVDLGSNRLPTLPVSLLSDQPALRMLYLDDNRLSNTTQLTVLSASTKLEYLDVSGNVFTELNQVGFDALPASTSIHLADNPLHCSCGTVDVIRWLAARSAGAGPMVADNQSVMCASPTSLLAIRPFTDIQSNLGLLPGAWTCRWKQSFVITVLLLLIFILAGLVLSIACRIFRRQRGCSGGGSGGGSPSCSPAAAASNGLTTLSSVTISNSCYGSGSCYGNGATGCNGAVGGPCDSQAQYRPLVDDCSASVVDLDNNSSNCSGVSAVTGGARSKSRTIGGGAFSPSSSRHGAGSPAGNGFKKSSTGAGRRSDNKALLDCTVTDVEDSL